MSTMGERLKEALELRDMQPPSLIAGTKLSKGTIYNMLNDTTRPEKVWADTAGKVCAYLGINRDWLLRGVGPREAIAGEADDGHASVKAYSQAVGLSDGAEAEEYAETHKLKFRAESLARKRLVPGRLAVMYGAGDSMEPRIHSGDAVMFDTGDTRPRDGQLYVIMVPGAGADAYTVKRCEIVGDLVMFRADNPKGDHNWRKPRRMDDPRHPIQVIGRVRWIGSWED